MPRSKWSGSTAWLVVLAIAGSSLAQTATPPSSLPPVPQPVALGSNVPHPPPTAQLPSGDPLGPASTPESHESGIPGEPIHHRTVYIQREKHGSDWLFEGEYLLLAARRGGQTYAIVGTNPNWGPVGSIQSVDGHYDSGLRVAVGYRFADELEVFARYSYFRSTADGVAPAPDGGTVFATLTHPSTIVLVDGASASSSLNFNVFDFEVGKRFELGEKLQVRVFAGPRYANLDQRLTATYQGGDVAKDVVTRQLDFEGGGLRAGAESQWKLLDHLGLYLRGSASMLTGQFTARASEIANDEFVIVDVTERYTRVVPIMDLGLGLSFQKGNFRISGGYEFITWFNMVEFSDFVDDAHPGKRIRSVGNLGFDGIVFRAEWSF